MSKTILAVSSLDGYVRVPLGNGCVLKPCSACKTLLPVTLEYFGKNSTKRDDLQHVCRPCKKAADARYLATHRAERRAYQQAHALLHALAAKAWRVAHPEEVSASNAAYRAAHQEERRTYCTTWRAENPELMREIKSAWRAAHPKECRAYEKMWRAAHPEKVKAMAASAAERRRAHMAGAFINDFTSAQWLEMQAMYAYRCVYCPLDCPACKKKSHQLTIDHITPLAKEGNNTASNILPACQSCNSKKGVKNPTVPVQPILLMQALPKKGRSLIAGMQDVEETADGWIRITLPKGVIAKFSRFEFALALQRGKRELRALKQAVREQRHLSQQEADLLAWIDA